ncbi:MAG TPA: hypothetical protein VFJ52_00485, partial [Terriglobia bacterium]|nr:hypothetical protein [Terriglobia bacterium]
MNDTIEIANTDSPELAAQRQELGLLHNIFSVLGQATIRAHECKRAAEVLDYVQAKIDVLEAAVQSQAEVESKAMSEAVLDAMHTPGEDKAT